jgi:hypothetical protein
MFVPVVSVPTAPLLLHIPDDIPRLVGRKLSVGEIQYRKGVPPVIVEQGVLSNRYLYGTENEFAAFRGNRADGFIYRVNQNAGFNGAVVGAQDQFIIRVRQ